MSNENPKAFKLWMNESVVKKYFKNTNLNAHEIQKIKNQLVSLELKSRVQLIAHELKKALPNNYPKALRELLKITRTENLKSFELWPATEFIQIYGLEHIKESINAMYELTPRFTAEFSIRPFINKYGEQIYAQLECWRNDPNEHIRRWLSEGTRPRLPWGEKLHAAVKNPQHGLKILEHLKFDNALYVRKSVANHLNDIAKDHPELVIQTLSSWQKHVPKNYEKEFKFISHRALRTLIKNGHPEALKFSGVDLNQKNLKLTSLQFKKTNIQMGDFLEFNFSITNVTNKKIKYIADYTIYFKKNNAKLSPKVFKLKTGVLEPGEVLNITKKHGFKPITTRKYYSGRHQIAIKLNGHEFDLKNFNLLKPL